MRRRICTIGGTAVWLHPAALLFVLYMTAAGYGRLCVCGLASITLHEISHGAAAALCHYPPKELELTPLGCVLRMEDEGAIPPMKRLVIVLAGPLCTVLLCAGSVQLAWCGWLAQDTARLMFACNAAILAVNLLPALPLDGGRLLALALGTVLPAHRVRSIMRVTGVIVGLGLITAGVAACLILGGVNLSLPLAGCFVLYASSVASTSSAMAELQRLMARKSRMEMRGMMRTAALAVMAGTPLRQAVSCLHPARFTQVLILEPGTMRVLATVGEDALIAAYLDAPTAVCGTLTGASKSS